MSRALIIVDVQNDFCEGGSLAVTGGVEVAAAIAHYATASPGAADQEAPAYDHVVATADWHVDPGDHWSDSPDFVDSWPVHCRVGTPGADFRPEVGPALDRAAAVFRKGQYEAAYSGFEGTTDVDGHAFGLADWLRDRSVDSVDVVGIATDHCVRATALDALREGFATTVLLDLTAGVAADTTEAAIEELRAFGVSVRPSAP